MIEIIPLSTPELLEKSFKLRYSVYCLERGFLPCNTGEKDEDEYDPYAIHVGAVQEGELIGSVRLILPSSRWLPVYVHCDIDDEWKHLEIDYKCAEVSRLVIPREHRTLKLATQLYKGIVLAAKAEGMERCVAAMEPTLARLLQRAKFQVQQIGPSAYYLGLINPYLLQEQDKPI